MFCGFTLPLHFPVDSCNHLAISNASASLYKPFPGFRMPCLMGRTLTHPATPSLTSPSSVSHPRSGWERACPKPAGRTGPIPGMEPRMQGGQWERTRTDVREDRKCGEARVGWIRCGSWGAGRSPGRGEKTKEHSLSRPSLWCDGLKGPAQGSSGPA